MFYEISAEIVIHLSICTQITVASWNLCVCQT